MSSATRQPSNDAKRNLDSEFSKDAASPIDRKNAPSQSASALEATRSAWLVMAGTCSNMPGAAMRSDLAPKYARPRTPDEVQALQALFQKAQSKASERIPKERLDELYALYCQHTPACIRERNVMRTIKTLDTLLEHGVSPERLSSAARNAAIRDYLAQTSAGLIGYGGSWFAGTTVALTMVSKGFSPGASVLFSSLTTAVGARLMTRWLRLSDAGPTWRRAISGADDKGIGVPAIRSRTGFALASAAYWPFLATLYYVTAHSPHPARADNTDAAADRASQILDARRFLNFAATAGVAAHRYFSPHMSRYLSTSPLDVEHVWLDGTNPKRLIGAVDELSTLDLVWPAIRGVRNLLGSLGPTLVPWLGDVAEASKACMDRKSESDLEAAQPNKLLDELVSPPDRLAKDSMILLSLFAVVAATGLLRALASDPKFAGHRDSEPERMTTHPGRVDLIADTFLVLAWGVAMAGADLISGSIDSIAADNQRVTAQRNGHLEAGGEFPIREHKDGLTSTEYRERRGGGLPARSPTPSTDSNDSGRGGPPPDGLQPAVSQRGPGPRPT